MMFLMLKITILLFLKLCLAHLGQYLKNKVIYIYKTGKTESNSFIIETLELVIITPKPLVIYYVQYRY